jgi:hypothetical protein
VDADLSDFLLGTDLGFCDDLARLLCGFLILMMLPGADRGVDEAAKEKEEANKDDDPGHATIELMSFAHWGCLAH